jgi:hypothetical protein
LTGRGLVPKVQGLELRVYGKALCLQRKEAAERKSFLELLGECERVRSKSSWSSVRRYLAKDPRFQILDEDRRTEVFAQYTAELRDAEQARLRRGKQTFKVIITPAFISKSTIAIILKLQNYDCPTKF